MPINFYYEMQQIVHYLKKAEGNKACEAVVVSNIRKHFEQGCSELVLETYLKELIKHLGLLIESNKGTLIGANYKYAYGFINTLLEMPSVKNWVKTTGL
ncbi:hypothetical protein A3860_14050 [Niastella vici]|uniref:Uncharacterized protein n=1 Tax=Niastella vici TaxID=1703345 RepID=A0A1V9G592_9BACT|nr:hypothetical protein [Niastella vici]OQP65722.1 hypothetical protein A3860_14050 [Niastella vici]